MKEKLNLNRTNVVRNVMRTGTTFIRQKLVARKINQFTYEKKHHTKPWHKNSYNRFTLVYLHNWHDRFPRGRLWLKSLILYGNSFHSRINAVIPGMDIQSALLSGGGGGWRNGHQTHEAMTPSIEDAGHTRYSEHDRPGRSGVLS